eukprot:1888681-Ditylum_brightwellii.AAC.1
MSAVDSNMSSVALKTYDEVTAVQREDGQTWLMGIRCGAYSPTLTDNEAVVNNHWVHEAGWKLDCVAKWHGGSQCIWYPTSYELKMIPIHWVDCHIDDLEINDGTKPVQKKNQTLDTLIINLSSM